MRRARHPLALAAAALALAAAACGTRDDATAPPSADAPRRTRALAPPPTYGYRVLRALPHDPAAFTQGLSFDGGILYESTGLVGESDVRQVDLETGTVLRRTPLPAPYFGEGSVVVRSNLYQLTWQHGTAFTYEPRTLARNRLTFDYPGEGWGLTYDGTWLVMSDGTPTIRFVHPKTFAVVRTIDVADDAGPVWRLNELEWVNGELLANVWLTDRIARIDPATGNVTGWIDLTGILPPEERTGNEDVLNGIAYDAANDALYVTGKRWPKLFRIALLPR